MRRLPIIVAAAAVLALPACGGDSDDEPAEPVATQLPETVPAEGDEGSAPEQAADPADTDAASVEEQAADAADEIAEDLQETQDAIGGGGATLVVGDRTWEFESVLCAFGADEIGQEDAELVVSSLQDGLQLYVSIDSFGHLITVDDIEDFENPAIALISTATGDFIEVDGTSVSASSTFTDDVTGEAAQGTLEVSCP